MGAKQSKCDDIILPDESRILYAVGKKLGYDDAVEYCKEHGFELASLYDSDVIKYVWGEMHDHCKVYDHSVFNVGMKTTGGYKGVWQDGTVFSRSRHSRLFQDGTDFFSQYSNYVATMNTVLDDGWKLSLFYGVDSVINFFCSEPYTAPAHDTSVGTFAIPISICIGFMIIVFCIFKQRKYRQVTNVFTNPRPTVTIEMESNEGRGERSSENIN